MRRLDVFIPGDLAVAPCAIRIPDALAFREGGMIALVGDLGRPEAPSTEGRPGHQILALTVNGTSRAHTREKKVDGYQETFGKGMDLRQSFGNQQLLGSESTRCAFLM